MRAYFNKRKTSPFHVRLSSDEAVDVLNECAEAVNSAYENGADELPALSKLHDILNAAVARAAKEST